MLYIVATPIGNLADFTYRAAEVLKSCAYILCEDTRHSRVLLDRYEIKTPLKSFHKFNEASREESVLEDLKKGVSVAVISDAGTPVVSDPGMRLVKACREEGIPITSIPGACAFLTAFTLAGWEGPFQFVGFFPKKQEEIERLLSYKGITIGYESPQRLCKTLALLPKTTHVAVARELTKLHEDFREGPSEELLSYYTEKPPKGEIVLLIKGCPIESLTDEELICLVKEKIEGERKNFSDAVRQVAKEAGCSRGHLYKIALEKAKC